MEENKKLLSEEHLRKIWHRSNYKINESPRYRKLVNDSEEFDKVPYMTQDGQPVPQGPSHSNVFNEAGEQEDAVLAQQKDIREPSNRDPIFYEDKEEVESPEKEDSPEPEEIPDAPTPAFDKEEREEEDVTTVPEVEPEVDEIQNEIIKHNTEAMKSIHNELKGLNNTVSSLNSKIKELNTDVEEVREPTNAEKLIDKKDTSYPYYFNLNDFWKNNWFDENNNADENGIRELPDGSYVADFDDLPQKSKIDIDNSFYKIT